MSNLVEKESNLTPKSTGNPIDLKIAVKSKTKDDSSQENEMVQRESPESRFLYFLANLANDELVYVDCPPKSTSDALKTVKEEKSDSLDGLDNFDKQEESDKSTVLLKDSDYCECITFDTDDDVDFMHENRSGFDTDDDTYF